MLKITLIILIFVNISDANNHEGLQTSKIIPCKEDSSIDLNSSLGSSNILYNSDNNSITINKKTYKSTLLFFPAIYVDYKIDKDKLIFITNNTASRDKTTMYYFFHRRTLLLEKIEEVTCDNYNKFCTISINYFNKPFHLSQMENDDIFYTFLEKSNRCNITFDSFYPNTKNNNKITFRRLNYTINHKKYSFLYDKEDATLHAYVTKSGTLYGISCSDTSKHAQIVECKVNNRNIDCTKVLDANISE